MAREESAKVFGGRVLVFGDLHFSSSFSGQHKNYQYECYSNMDKITSLVKENKASAVIFLGDLVGVNEKAIRDRQFLMRTMLFFETLNKLTNRHVFSVKGNHDMGDFTDFDLFQGMGYIKNPKYIDYYGINSDTKKQSFEIRFHLVNYGDEHKPLNLAGNDGFVTDVVLGHADYYIEGVTNWYSAGTNIELGKLDNFIGVDLVFSGHIHIPSDEILYTGMKDGSTVGLFFTGSPSRVAERFDDCWYLDFEYKKNLDGWSTEYESHYMGLDPAEQVFYPKEDFIDVDEVETDEDVRALKSTKLTEIVKEVIDSRIMSGDLNRQIDIMPGVSEEVKGIAKKYLELASM